MILGLTLGIGAVVATGPAHAQDNLERGKSAAQLFASDCTPCHKSPQGLSKAAGLFGLSSFLREHYTSSKESAAALAAYIEQVDRGPAAPDPRAAPTKRAARPAAKKPDADKPAEGAKPGEAKAEAPKAAETKPAEAKPAEAKPAEAPKAEKSE